MGSKSTSWDFSSSDLVRVCIESIQRGPSELEANSKCNLQSAAFGLCTWKNEGSKKGRWGGREGGNTEPETAGFINACGFRPSCGLMTGRGFVQNGTVPAIKCYRKWKVVGSSHVSGMSLFHVWSLLSF